jgi:tryptophan 2,3-dioxygenase
MEDIEEKGTLRASLEKWLFRTPIVHSSPPAPSDPNFTEAFAADQKVVRSFAEDYVQRGIKSGWDERHAKNVTDYLRGVDEEPQDWETERIRISMLFIQLYPDLPLLAWPRMLLERIIELEEALSNFRNAHARTAERVIGSRPGTGGSPGIKYLDLTRDTRIFPELVKIRGILIPASQRWIFPGMEAFGFREKKPS